MARMFNMAQDFTYDMFVEDAGLYKATPMKGVHPRRNASDRELFMTWFKDCVRDFKAQWNADHDGRLYDRHEGYIGDAFEKEMAEICFSDFYKDTYGQRPHLPAWFYIHLVDLPHGSDTSRLFCATPVEDAARRARECREAF